MSEAGSTSATSSAFKNRSLPRHISGMISRTMGLSCRAKKSSRRCLAGAPFSGVSKDPAPMRTVRHVQNPFSSRDRIEVGSIYHLRHSIVDSAEEVEPPQVRAEAPTGL